MGTSDFLAVLFFVLLWFGFSQSTQPWHALGRKSLSQRMNAHRRAWFRVAARRDLRMIDTAILGGLQNGTAFFASTTIFAIGGCFALLGATDEVLNVFRTLPLEIEPSPVAFEIKVIGLTGIFAYAFFKFGWAYRLFNYSSILFGAIPPASIEEDHPGTLDAYADRAADMNILAGQSFNAGLRAIFVSIGYLGWFAGPMALMASSLLVIIVLVRRQFLSPAHDATIEIATIPADIPAPGSKAMTGPREKKVTTATVRAVLRAFEAARPGASIDPGAVAREIAGPDPDRWGRAMKPLRPVLVALAQAGEIELTRKGKPISPGELRGVYRLRVVDLAPNG